MINFVMESFVNSERKMTKFRPHPITLTNLPIKEIDKVNAVMEYIAMMTDVEIPTNEEDSKNEQEV